MKTEVYTWRVSSELKSDLEREARSRKTSLSAVLSLAVRDWLKKSVADVEDDERQRSLHAAAADSLGTLAGNNSRRAESARHAVKERLRRRHAR